MDRDRFKTLGREFKAMIKDFMNTGDFEKINRDVGNTVGSALDIAFKEVESALSSLRMGQYFHDKENAEKDQRDSYAKKQTQTKSSNQTQNQVRYQSYNQNRHQYQQATHRQRWGITVPTNFPAKPVGRVSGVLLKVFGGILMSAFLLAILIMLSTNLVQLSAMVVFAVFAGIGAVMTAQGSVIRERLKRFRQYIRLINNRSTCPIRELSDNSGYSERYIIKDLRRMIANGMLPQGHIASDKSFIMLNRESYQLYLEHRRDLEDRQDAARQEDAKQNSDRSSAQAETGDSARGNAIEEARLNIEKLRQAKVNIADAEVSGKAKRLVQLSELIIEYVDTHPEKIGEVRRFFAYYLPTAIKLLNAYLEFDQQPVQGENIMTAKQEINGALDTINHAFENLLDSLFENAALDVSADISVLRTILAQDGLAENDFQ